MEIENINSILSKVFKGYEIEHFAGIPTDTRFKSIQAYIKKFPSGDEINFIPIMAKVIEETERFLKQ